MKALSLKGIWTLIKDAFKGFSEDKLPKLGGSLAYFTIFSLGPMLLVVIYLAGIFLGREAVEGSLYGQIRHFVDENAAMQLQQLIKNASINKQGIIAAIIGIVALLVGATSVFAEIQDSINTIWKLKMKPNLHWTVMVKTRVLAFGVIATLGFLLLVSMTASVIIEGLGKKLEQVIPAVGRILLYGASQALTLVVATFLFSIIFKVLPAAEVKWKQVWPGAIATAILFMLGRFAISFYISKSDFASTYGAAGSLVVLLVWVYYSSLILYFGAELTKAYADRFSTGIRPNKYAVATTEKPPMYEVKQAGR